MPDLATTVLLGLVAYRAARLIATDSISEQARAVLYRWSWDDSGRPGAQPEPRGRIRPYFYELVTCPFCIGVWMAGLAYLVWGLMVASFDSVPVGLLAVLGIAGVQSLCQLADGALYSTAEDDG